MVSIQDLHIEACYLMQTCLHLTFYKTILLAESWSSSYERQGYLLQNPFVSWKLKFKLRKTSKVLLVFACFFVTKVDKHYKSSSLFLFTDKKCEFNEYILSFALPLPLFKAWTLIFIQVTRLLQLLETVQYIYMIKCC